MITCHFINVLKAFQSPLQDKTQNWNRKYLHASTHTHKLTHIYCMLSNVTDCHLRMQLGIFFVCAYWNAISNRRCLCILVMGKQQRAKSWRKKTWRLLPTLWFRSNVLQCKWWRVQGVHLIPNNKWYQSQMGAIKDLLGEWEEGQKRKRVSGFVLSPGALKHSNYHTAVKMHPSSSHWDDLSCSSATHWLNSQLFTQALK